MLDYDYKTTKLIAEFFEDKGIPYRVSRTENIEEVTSGFSVESGPNILVHYVNADDDNDLTVLISIVNDVPSDRRIPILEACNELNRDCHHVCFFLSKNNDIMFSYDFFYSMTDECIGEAALEILVRTKHVLDENYSVLMRALYVDDTNINIRIDDTFRKMLSEISSSNHPDSKESSKSESEGND